MFGSTPSDITAVLALILSGIGALGLAGLLAAVAVLGLIFLFWRQTRRAGQ